MRCSIAMLCLALCWQVGWDSKDCTAQEVQKEPQKEAENDRLREAAKERLKEAAIIAAQQRMVPAQALQMVEGAQVLPMFRAAPANPFGATSGLQIDLRSLVLAKYDEGPKGPQIVALVEQTRMETKTVKVTNHSPGSSDSQSKSEGCRREREGNRSRLHRQHSRYAGYGALGSSRCWEETNCVFIRYAAGLQIGRFEGDCGRSENVARENDAGISTQRLHR